MNDVTMRARILSLLDQPRPREYVLQHCVQYVPPGQAWRRREADRGRKRILTKPHPPKPMEEAIRVGARHIVSVDINGLVRRQVIERYSEDGVTMLRMRERC